MRIRHKNHPRADASSRYHATLKRSSKAYPRATDFLMRAERHRSRRWQQFIDPIDLQAIDLLLDYLMSVSQSLEEDANLAGLAFLPERIAGDVKMSLEGILSGYLQIASDSMRDIIETELLIRDFALDTNQIDSWRNASDDVLRRRFQPVHLRQRQANALGCDIKDVPGATDYAAHSKLLHAGRTVLFERSLESAMAGHEVTTVLDSIGDVMFHGTSAVRALDLLLNAIGRPAPDPARALAALESASDDLSEARAAVEAMEWRIAESLPAAGNWEITLFESGFIIAFSPVTDTAMNYRIDRIDFRTLHRSLSEGHAVSFELISLGEMTPIN
jgi:hypothetical protein